MNEHYTKGYEPDVRSPDTNIEAYEYRDNLNIELARLCQRLEIENARLKKKVSDHEWEKSPGQGMQPQGYWDEGNSPSYGWN